MLEVIKKFVRDKEKGLMLLDLPTGFGKTTAMLEYVKEFLNKDSNDIKRIFIVTNLKSNLPSEKKLREMLNEKYEGNCLILKSIWENVYDNFDSRDFEHDDIKNSQEYKDLKLDIEMSRQLEENFRKAENIEEKKKIKRSLDTFKKKIETLTEVKFRKYLKVHHFENKNKNEKEKYIKEHLWMKKIYPACKLNDDKCKVIITTTKKFFMPIDTFYKMPFYIYNDNLSENTITFIDEFDTTKNELLDIIINEGLKIEIDLLSLFLNIYYSLKNVELPKEIMKLSEYREEKVENKEWETVESLLTNLKEEFERTYKEYNLNLLTKSKNFSDKKAFIFNDNRSINIIKENSKNILGIKIDKEENYLNIISNKKINYGDEKKQEEYEKFLYNNFLKKLNYNINGFIIKLSFIAKNYNDYRNKNKRPLDTKYSYEDSVLTILSAFNISSEYKQILAQKIINKNADKLKYSNDRENDFYKKGFEFIEIVDDTTHDLQTKSHCFKFDTTPENLLVKLAVKSRVIGISATASIDTIIGNYSIDYIKKTLKNDFYSISNEDYERLNEEFEKRQIIFEKENININNIIVDNYKEFSDEENCKNIIENELFNDKEKKDKYIQELEKYEEKYYFYIICKLAKIYKSVGKNNKIYSFLAFLNTFPGNKKENKKYIDEHIMKNMFEDIAKDNNFEYYNYYIVKSSNYDYEFEKINKELENGKKVFVISTYKTIGNGKNIQYSIPEIENVKSNIVIKKNDKVDNKKDFDSIYLSTPTNLVKGIQRSDENMMNSLCKYLFDQEYLLQKKYISYGANKLNIEKAFRVVFYNEIELPSKKENKDIILHTAQLIIQAVGRICRCMNKNKEINIFIDRQVVERLNTIKSELLKKTLNKEFKNLLNLDVELESICIENYNKQNKDNYVDIKGKSKEVRKNVKNIREWEDMRKYALKYPTTDAPSKEYERYYFHFDQKQTGYFFETKGYEITKISFRSYLNNSVSEDECGLKRMLCVPMIENLFKENNYATKFNKGNYIMSQSFYKQIYKGALGEVVGKKIIENSIDIKLEELEDKFYEFFDYKYKDIYFDFKHWDGFIVNEEDYRKAIYGKLKQLNGKKVIIINILKREENIYNVTNNDKIVEIPYLINEDNEIDEKMINKIIEEMEN